MTQRYYDLFDNHDTRERWYLDDPVDGLGVKGYRVVTGMRIDRSKVQGAHIFRPWGWLVALVVSEELKLAMEALGGIGPDFVEV